ncbi:hypothetical protein BKA69DRAFT_414747 [Paraphysoderma sedebokerense]|nr:hypothetical protein BKA69DRAFT_414747 [Paraphysoderma sedebokerense]
MCFLKLKEYNNVVKEYERLLKLYATLDVLPPPKLFYRLSMAFSSLSDASSAFQALENGLRLYPNHRELTVESKKLKADTKRIERVWGNLVGEYLKNGGDESATIDNETQSEDAKFVKEEEKDVFGLENVEGCESEEESLWPSEATAGSIKNYSDLDVEDTSNDEIIPSGHGSHDLERALCGEEEEEIEWGKHSEQELEAWKQLWTDKEGENSNTTVPSASTTDICSDQLQEHKPSVPTELPLSPPPSPAALLDTIDLKDVHMSLLKSFSVNVTYSVNSIRNQILTNVKALWDVRKKWKNWDGLEADESQSAVGSQINEDNTEESKGKTSKKPTRLFNIEEYADEVVLLIMERMALQRMIGMVTVGGSIGAAGKIIVYPSFSGSSKCSTADSDREEEEEMRKQSELIEANLPLRPIPELPIPWNEIRRKVSLFELYEELTNVYHPEMSFMLTKVINWLRSGSKQVASLCKDLENRGVMGEEFKFSPSAGLSETDEELERKKKKEKEKINKLKPIYQSICVRIVRGLVDIGVARLVEVKGIGAKVRITFRILDVDELGQLKWQKDGHCDDIGGDISDEESAEDDGRGTNGGLSITDVL